MSDFTVEAEPSLRSQMMRSVQFVDGETHGFKSHSRRWSGRTRMMWARAGHPTENDNAEDGWSRIKMCL